MEVIRKKASYSVILENPKENTVTLRKTCGCTRISTGNASGNTSRPIYFCEEHGMYYSSLPNIQRDLYEQFDSMLVRIALNK
uniref:Uncharacterized protein n=1 Tax=viral metagenome TaxID=1070528 RepID=A0A6C0CKD7_9ZZZZ